MAQIFARRIQKLFRQYKVRKASIVSHRRKLFAESVKVTIRKPPVIKSIPIRTSADRLLTQAKLCLDNKRVDDRLKPKVQKYLIDTPKGEETLVKQRFYIR